MSKVKDFVKIGTVSAVHYDAGTVDVVFKDKDDMVSSDLPLLSNEYNMPNVGDNVLCMFLGNGPFGFCLGKYYSKTNIPAEPGEGIFNKDLFGEGFVKYDSNTKTLTLSAQNVVIDGNLNVKGNITATGTITGNIP